MKQITLAALLCAASTLAANAATYNYSYTFTSGGVVTGSLEGTLQADMNTVQITSMDTPSYNGTPNSQTLTLLGAWSSSATTPAITSLDGTVQDFVYVDTTFNYGFGLDTANTFGAGEGYSDLGAFDFALYGGDWSIELAPIPLPASGVMLGFALFGAGYAARRKATAA